jgi:hypothetical protein
VFGIGLSGLILLKQVVDHFRMPFGAAADHPQGNSLERVDNVDAGINPVDSVVGNQGVNCEYGEYGRGTLGLPQKQFMPFLL